MTLWFLCCWASGFGEGHFLKIIDFKFWLLIYLMISLLGNTDFSKETKELHTENYKTLMKKIKEPNLYISYDLNF